ncbi:MAG TPA: UDP-N-acetylglucosamine--N-acetylmuramyl-(pentapeptide) pyrophosphoryl-undecaprenol N-acetylglucosamine transferase [Candidatus Saccharimonadales bacterium]
MTIVVTGGGSGGHITPLLAVAHELKRQLKDVKIVYIGQKGDALGDIPAQSQDIDEVHFIRAGKFRRYHGEGLKQLLDVVTLFKNLRDAVWVLVGMWQSFWLLGKLRPQVIFVKGGFVGVPVGFMAALRHIPYVTHDSDALPGLANRIIARWAKVHTVALPKEIYSYPVDKTVTVGVPLVHQYKQLSAKEVAEARHQIGISQKGRVLMVTGGGLGALRLNNAVAACMPELLDRYRDLTVIHVAGRNHEAELRKRYQQELAPIDQPRVIVKGFITNMYLYSGAADVVITRAGATAMAEFAAQAKACIVVPNPLLTGGHQLKNAKVLADRMAIKMVSENTLQHDDHALMPPLVELFDKPERAAQLGTRLHTFAEPDSAKRLAVVLLEVAGKQK